MMSTWQPDKLQVPVVAKHVVVRIGVCEVQGSLSHGQWSLSHFLSETLLAVLTVLSSEMSNERGVKVSPLLMHVISPTKLHDDRTSCTSTRKKDFEAVA